MCRLELFYELSMPLAATFSFIIYLCDLFADGKYVAFSIVVSPSDDDD